MGDLEQADFGPIGDDWAGPPPDEDELWDGAAPTKDHRPVTSRPDDLAGLRAALAGLQSGGDLAAVREGLAHFDKGSGGTHRGAEPSPEEPAEGESRRDRAVGRRRSAGRSDDGGDDMSRAGFGEGSAAGTWGFGGESEPGRSSARRGRAGGRRQSGGREGLESAAAEDESTEGGGLRAGFGGGRREAGGSKGVGSDGVGFGRGLREGAGAGSESGHPEVGGETDGGSRGSGFAGGGRRNGRRASGGREGSARAGRGGPKEEGPPRPESEVAREICIRQLAVRPRTRVELAKALAKREISDEVIAEVLDRYDEVGMIDDAAFARAWVSSRHQGRGLARRALANELRQRGVDAEVAGAALESVDDEAEAATARALVDRKLRTVRGEPDAVFRKLVSMLARKGYGAGVAIRAVKDALAERDAEAAEFAEQIDPDAMPDE